MYNYQNVLLAKQIREHESSNFTKLRVDLMADLYLLTNLERFSDEQAYEYYSFLVEQWMLWDSPSEISWDRIIAVIIRYIIYKLACLLIKMYKNNTRTIMVKIWYNIIS